MPNQTAERNPQLPATVAQALSEPIVADDDAGREYQLARVIERVAIIGDLALMAPADRVLYYAYLCRSLGLNPLTRPFEFISLNGKLTLYPRRDTTDQLRVKRGVTIDKVERQHDTDNDLAIITAWGHTPDGRQDQAQGIVFIGSLKGEGLANAWMKAETKAKRRLTLSLVGLGMLDETEVADTPTARRVEVDPDDGTIKQIAAPVEGTTRSEQVLSVLEAQDREQDVADDQRVLEGDELDRWLRGCHAAMRTRTEDDVHEQLRAVAAATVELGDRSLNDMTLIEWRRTANAIASLPVIEQPASSVAGENGEAAEARVSASPTDSVNDASESASEAEPVQAGNGGPPADQPAPAHEQPEQSAIGVSGVSPSREGTSAPASPTTLVALRQSPSQETFLAFALEVLGREGEQLSDLTAEDLDQVISEAVDSENEWAVLYQALPSIVKAQLRAKRQHPRGREESKALPNHPTAEQMKAALDTEQPS